jgi:glutamate-ammonia-ligase adenylyltransferase
VDDASAELSDLAAGTLEAALATPGPGPDRGRTPGCGDRTRQVRRARAELRLRRRRDLRLEPADGVDEAVAARVATQLASI